MNAIRTIRTELRVTQSELAEALGVSQGNVSFYEQGQQVPPSVAERLIAFAKSKGRRITYNDVYGLAKPSRKKVG